MRSERSTRTLKMVLIDGIINPKHLDKIDKLFNAGVGEYLALPQLVVVGDQSSGKSSVLEGLTNIPFPRDSGLCTRFATQITFRRAAQLSYSVTIIPSHYTDAIEADRLRSWKKHLLGFSVEIFTEIMKEVRPTFTVLLPDH